MVEPEREGGGRGGRRLGEQAIRREEERSSGTSPQPGLTSCPLSMMVAGIRSSEADVATPNTDDRWIRRAGDGSGFGWPPASGPPFDA